MLKGEKVQSAMIAILGLPHYYRILATYGTLIPSAFIVPDTDAAQWNEFVQKAYDRTRPRLILYIVVMFPILVTWCTPSYFRFIRSELRSRTWTPIYLLITLFFFAAVLTMFHDQLRYFAPMTPFLFVTLALQLRSVEGKARPIFFWLSGLTLLSMMTSSLAAAIFNPGTAVVIPGLFFLIPYLRFLYI